MKLQIVSGHARKQIHNTNMLTCVTEQFVKSRTDSENSTFVHAGTGHASGEVRHELVVDEKEMNYNSCLMADTLKSTYPERGA